MFLFFHLITVRLCAISDRSICSEAFLLRFIRTTTYNTTKVFIILKNLLSSVTRLTNRIKVVVPGGDRSSLPIRSNAGTAARTLVVERTVRPRACGGADTIIKLHFYIRSPPTRDDVGALRVGATKKVCT